MHTHTAATLSVVVASPLGALALSATDEGIVAVHFVDDRAPTPLVDDGSPRASHLARLSEQLARYFARTLTRFDVPLAPVGTEFERRVWKALVEIPHGQTRSYLDVARTVGGPNHTRAVGGANGKNPIAIVVPCHRVIASDGGLGGYAGGLERKRALLAIEAPSTLTLDASSTTNAPRGAALALRA